jgi:prepilin-type N-terminal cleavage/methylation domain-containing protein
VQLSGLGTVKSRGLMNYFSKDRVGFTLIELLITISIMGLLLTIGLVYYQDFNRRQIVVQAAGDLKNNLRLAQSKALAGEKEGCVGTFGGYQVDFSSDEYVISVLCDGIPVEYRRYPLIGLAWAGGPPYLIFKPLAGGVENPETAPAEITLSNSSNYSSKVIVDEGGEISLKNNVDYVSPPTPTPTPSPLPPGVTPLPTPTPTSFLCQYPIDFSRVTCNGNICLNAASGCDCDRVCQSQGFTGCLSVGTDSGANNGNNYFYNRFSGCRTALSNCSSDLPNNGGTECLGIVAEWAYCNCSTTPLPPTPTPTPGPPPTSSCGELFDPCLEDLDCCSFSCMPIANLCF